MNTIRNLEQFVNLYSLNKTLRFELKPIGDTLKNIETSGLLDQDRHRDGSYSEVKKLIDRYHKDFIERVLSDFTLGEEQLEKYDHLYHISNKSEKDKDELKKVQEALRKQIHNAFKKAGYTRMGKKELITEDLPDFLKEDDEKELVKEFESFTTYFIGFYENRKNMYSDEPQATAIGFRLIHENLPRFIDNIDSFRKIAAVEELADKLPSLYKSFESYLNVREIGDIFSLDYFSDVLTQRHIDVYNAIVGGKTEKDGSKLQGLNEYVNLYNQQHKDAKLPLLKRLYKQILSDRETVSWLPEQFTQDGEVLTAVAGLWQELSSETLPAMKDLLLNLAEYDAGKIYLPNDTLLTSISQKAYGHWGVVKDALKEQLRSTTPKLKKRGKEESEEAYEERIDKVYKSRDSFSLEQIDEAVATFLVSDDDAKPSSVVAYFTRLGAAESEEDIFCLLGDAHRAVQSLLESEYPSNKKLVQDKKSVALIKDLLDRLKAVQHFIKPLLGHGDEPDKDERFYGELMPLWDSLDRLTPLYNKVRNYLTQKPYSQEKIKLNFENSTLAAGWDLNKERDNTCVILRRDGQYYLAIMQKRFNKAFMSEWVRTDGNSYEKMVYKQISDPIKDIPHVVFSAKGLRTFCPSPEIRRIHDEKTYKSGPNFSLDDCRSLIDFYKGCMPKYDSWKHFSFSFSPTSS